MGRTPCRISSTKGFGENENSQGSNERVRIIFYVFNDLDFRSDKMVEFKGKYDILGRREEGL